MNTATAQHSTFDARILALGRRFREMDIDVDPSLMQRAPRKRHHAPANAIQRPAGGCVHRWRIEEASEGRRRLPATCSKCGQTGTFATSMPDPAEAR